MTHTTPLRALLLDAVGTVIRTREPPAAVYVRLARRHRLSPDPEQVAARLAARRIRPPPLDGVPLDEVPEREREGWREVVRFVLGEEAADGPCFERLLDHYARGEAWSVEAGAADALARSRARGLRVGVVSNMDARLPQVLGALGLSAAIDTLVLPSNTGFAKPDPRIFRVALERFGIEPDEGLYIGDREEDCVAAARAAGLRGLRYAPGEISRDPTLLTAWHLLEAHLT